MGKRGGRDAGAPMLGPNFPLPRYIKKSKRPSGSTAIHKKRQIWLQGFSRSAQGQRQKKLCSKEIVPRSFRTHLSGVAWTAPSCPGKRNSDTWVRVHEGRTRPQHVSSGVETANLCFLGHEPRGQFTSGRSETLKRPRTRARAALGPRSTERGGAGLGSVRRTSPSLSVCLSRRSLHFRGAGPVQCWRWQRIPKQFEATGCCTVSLLRCVRFLPLTLHAPGGGQSGSARLSWRPALHLPRARLARPDSPASSVGPRPARVQTRSPPRPGPAVGASAPPESLLALAARPPGAERRSQRPEKKRASETEGWPGQAVAPRRWSPSSGSVWPTRSTARISPSAATSPRPR